MTRFLTVGAAQMGPVGRNESRAAVVLRLLEMMREAKGRGCELVVFTECGLTPFFPRWWEEDVANLDPWFEREMPGPDTQILFHEAKKLGIGFHLGYAELAEENGQTHRYNASVLVGADGQIIGKYRKIHLPGTTTKDADNPHRCYEKRYFEVGNLGFRAWRAFGGVVGMCLGNDRRWPESFRMLGLQGAEVILLGYNTTANHPDHPELDYLTNFHSMISMQAGAYQNGCFVVGVAKAGNEEGFSQIGRTAIIAPSGEVVTQCTTLKDELIVHRCNLDQTRFYKDRLFKFEENRRIEAYSLLTKTRGPVSPFEPGQDLHVPWELPEEKPATLAFASQETVTDDDVPQDDPPQEQVPAESAVEILLPEPHGNAANLPGLTEENHPAETAIPQKEETSRETNVDPIEAIREVLKAEYNYSESQLEPVTANVVRALERQNIKESETANEPPKPAPQPKTLDAASEPLTQAAPSPGAPDTSSFPLTEVVPPETLPVADDIGWLPGRFSALADSADRMAACVDRLMKDYRYSEDEARKVAEQAEAAWLQMHPVEAEKPLPSEPAPTAVYIPEIHPILETPAEKGKPRTQYGASPKEKTFPSLSSEEAFHVFSVLSETYGYSARSARAIAERASSANRRWHSAMAEAQAAAANAPKETPTASLPPTIVTEPPADAKSAKGDGPVKADAPPDAIEGPYIIVPCPECEFPLKFDSANAALLGRKARCPKCQTKFRLPESV